MDTDRIDADLWVVAVYRYSRIMLGVHTSQLPLGERVVDASCNDVNKLWVRSQDHRRYSVTLNLSPWREEVGMIAHSLNPSNRSRT